MSSDPTHCPPPDPSRLAAALAASERRREQAEHQLQELAERVESAMACANLGLWDHDLPTGTVRRSRQWAEMLGYTETEITPAVTAWQNLIHPDDLPAVQATCEIHEAGQTPDFRVEHRLRTKTGGWKWVLNWGRIVARDDAGRPLRAIGAHMDIHGLKTAELARQAGEARYRSLVEALPDGVWETTPDGRITFCNHALSRLFGQSTADLLGRPCWRLPNRPGERRRLRRLCRQLAQGRERQTPFICSDTSPTGQPRHIQIGGNPLRDGEGRVTGLVWVATDLTAWRQAEQRNLTLIAQLNRHIQEIKTLRGIIPICAACKRIRDDHGYWAQLETYLHAHSEADFSHCLCPDCVLRLYPELAHPGGEPGPPQLGGDVDSLNRRKE